MEKVIVAITTYNLEKYVAQALDSVLMQKTNFRFKIIVADDCSTDGTIDILKEYKDKYPDIIDLKLSEKNLGSLANSNRLFDKIDAEYFSFLDGDDYWVDENRLQKQVDFMDAHKEYTLCGSNTKFLVNEKEGDDLIESKFLDKTYDFSNYLSDTIPFVHTSSILVRNIIFSSGLPKCYFDTVDTFENCALRGEDFRRILHLEKGKMYVSNDIYSYYRIHEKGIWQGSTEIHRKIEEAISYNFYRKYFKDKYYDVFNTKFNKSFRNLQTYLIKHNDFVNCINFSEKDIKLLNGLYSDIRINPVKQKENGLIKKVIGKLFFKFF